MKNVLSREFMSFLAILITILVTRQYAISVLIESGWTSFAVKMLVGTFFNVVLIFVSYIYIKRNDLFKLAGLSSHTNVHKIHLVIFPVVYLIALNLLLLDGVNSTNFVINIVLLCIYCLSIGFSEELSLRGFLQSYLVKHSGQKKQDLLYAVLIAAVIFGLLHFIAFDKGLYGELGQFFYASFIAFCFGMLLLVTKRLYPLILGHALIDVFGDLDGLGEPLSYVTTEPQSLSNAVLIVVLVSPVFIYAVYLYMRKLDNSYR